MPKYLKVTHSTMGYDSYDGTEVAEHSGQEMYGGKAGQHQVVPEDQIAATVAAAAAAAAEIQPSLNRVLSSIDYDLCFKHPLEHTWTLWHWENDRTKAWTDMLSDVTSFNTVEDFFRLGWYDLLVCFCSYFHLLAVSITSSSHRRI